MTTLNMEKLGFSPGRGPIMPFYEVLILFLGCTNKFTCSILKTPRCFPK